MCGKMKLDPFLISHTRTNSKWIKNLNIRPQTIKTVEENIGSKILDIAHGNFLSGISPQPRETKEKINKRDYMKLKSFCTAKEIINKKTAHRMGDIFADSSNKWLISKIYRVFIKLNTTETTQFKKWTKDMNRTSPKR